MENQIRSCGKDLRDYVSRLAIGFECSVIQYLMGDSFFSIRGSSPAGCSREISPHTQL